MEEDFKPLEDPEALDDSISAKTMRCQYFSVYFIQYNLFASIMIQLEITLKIPLKKS